MVQSTKHSEVIIIGDKAKRVNVSQNGKKQLILCTYTKQSIFLFYDFNFFILCLIWVASEVPSDSEFFR